MSGLDLVIYDRRVSVKGSQISVSATPLANELTICLNGMKIEDILKNKELFEECEYCELRDIKAIGLHSFLYESMWSYLMNNFDSILNMVDYVKIYSSRPIKDILDENPILKRKKILLTETLSINEIDYLNELIENYRGYDVNIMLNGNSEPVSLEECKETINFITNIGDYINSLNLTQFEKIMFTYDIVRDRVYTKEANYEKYCESRDLSKVIKGKSIVCVGYSAIFSAILDYLEITNFPVLLTPKKAHENRHERNEVHIVDPEYDINGFYYFDTTWDSRKNDNNDFLLSYKYFARTRDEIETFEKNRFIYSTSPKYSKKMFEELEKIAPTSNYGLITEYLATFNHILARTNTNGYFEIISFVQEKYSVDNIKDMLVPLLELYNKPISAEQFLKAVKKVRQLQNSIDPDKYDYSLTDMFNILMNSRWNFSDNYYSPNELLIKAVFGEDSINTLNIIDNFKNYMNYYIDESMNKESIEEIAESTRRLKIIN